MIPTVEWMKIALQTERVYGLAEIGQHVGQTRTEYFLRKLAKMTEVTLDIYLRIPCQNTTP